MWMCAHDAKYTNETSKKNCNTHFAINQAKNPGTKHKKSAKQIIHVA